MYRIYEKKLTSLRTAAYTVNAMHGLHSTYTIFLLLTHLLPYCTHVSHAFSFIIYTLPRLLPVLNLPVFPFLVITYYVLYVNCVFSSPHFLIYTIYISSELEHFKYPCKYHQRYGFTYVTLKFPWRQTFIAAFLKSF